MVAQQKLPMLSDKPCNIIPNGDASINDAMVNMGQRFASDCQGNWGDYRTGDGAAAARYIGSIIKICRDVIF
jgi:topoisomerase-4 subunit A